MKIDNKYLKNNILNNIINNSIEYSQNKSNSQYNNTFLPKNKSDKFIKKKILKIKRKSPIKKNYNKKKYDINQRKDNKYLFNKTNKDDTFLKDFFFSTGDNILNNISYEKNFLFTEANLTDKNEIKNLNRATIAILKENIPVSYFNNIYNEQFNLKRNTSKNNNLSHTFILEESSNSHSYNNNDSLSNNKNSNNRNSIIKHISINTNKIINDIRHKKNITKLPSSKNYNKSNKLFNLKNNRKNKKKKEQNEIEGAKYNLWNDYHKIIKDSYIKKYNNKTNSKKNQKDIGIYNHKNNISSNNKKRSAKSHERNIFNNIYDNTEKRIKNQSINNKKENYSINQTNNSKIKKEKNILLSSNKINTKINRKFGINMNNINTNKKFETIISKNNEDFFKYKDLKINNNINNEYYTLNNNNHFSKSNLKNIKTNTINNKTEIKTYSKLRRFKGILSNNKNYEKKNDTIKKDKKNKNNFIINISNIIKVDKKIKSLTQSNKNSIPKENKMPLKKRSKEMKISKNNTKKIKIIKSNKHKYHFRNNIKLENYFYQNENIDKKDICNKPIVSNYIQTPFFTNI